jgi:methylthioribose-1-phosphate isomerase
MTDYRSIEWIEDEGVLRLLDQSLLPGRVEYRRYDSAEGIAAAIGAMIVRGAPAIGVTAAYGLVAAAFRHRGDDLDTLRHGLVKADALLRASRPTAVNLSWALDEMARRTASQGIGGAGELRSALLRAAQQLAREDIAINIGIANHAMELMPAGKVTFIHHCNTGALATVGYGTALGVIRMAHEKGLEVEVFVDETRPRLQGARLTSWELKQLGIAHRIIVDGASSLVMRRFAVDMCIVGCDRVAANGDVANKVGTCNLAMVAAANGVPFYVAAPLSTLDLATACGADIEIEERDAEEITVVDGQRVAPEGVGVFNPAFDITPAHLLSAIITEKGVVYPPFERNLERIKAACR